MLQTASEDATDKAEKKPAGEKSPKSKATSSDPSSAITDKVSALIKTSSLFKQQSAVAPPSASNLLRKRQQATGYESDSEADMDGCGDDNVDSKQLFRTLLPRYRAMKWLYGHTARWYYNLNLFCFYCPLVP